MPPTRTTTPAPPLPGSALVILPLDDLAFLMEQVQLGFDQIHARFDAWEASEQEEQAPEEEDADSVIAAHTAAQLRKEIAAAALKAAVTRPPVRRTPRNES